MRVTAITLLVFSLIAACAQAQRGGAVVQSFTPGFSAPLGFPGMHHVGSFAGRGPGFGFNHHRHNHLIYPLYWPWDYPYDEASAYENPYSEVADREPAPAVAPSPAPPPPKAQVIEIPGDKRLTPAKPQPPAIFVLASGERLEASRFILTAANLSISINRRQRTIPIDQLDLDATIAANHERGIDLRVPSDRNEISLSF